MECTYLNNVSVLIVDDQDFIRSLIRQVLKSFGCKNIKDAADSEHAWSMVASLRPDIIIADWEMGSVSGLEFARRLRHDPESPDTFVPIIMMTGHADMERVVEARDAGINEYVVKPVSAKSLLSRLQSVIEHPRNFVRAGAYFGPDRRRRTVDVKEDRRGKEKAEVPVEAESQLGSLANAV